MDIRLKALLVLLPFIIAGYVGFALLQPAMEEATTKDNSVNEKTTESQTLEGKLAGSAQISVKQKELQAQIEKLRDSVPKSPDTDLLTIDLEKMCKDAGMNMVGLTAPKSEGGPARANKTVEDATKAKRDKLKNLLKGGTPAEEAAATAAAAGPAGGELEQLPKQFTVTGDYEGMQKLVHELETYQRVVRIDDISFHTPKKETGKEKIKIDDSTPTEGEDTGDPRLLFITMTLTSYYLP